VPSLLSVNVGLPKDVGWRGRVVHTGVWKSPTPGPHRVRTLNIDGDGQGDLAGHGGVHRAVLVYQVEAYVHWAEHFGWQEYGLGLFGENLTVDGLLDDEVRVGDRYRIGSAEFEVSQPRVTCFRVGLRVGEPTLPSLMVAHGRPGFYMRVITEGEIEAGQDVALVERGRDPLSISQVDALLYLPHRDPGQLATIVDNPALSPGWQQSFRDLLEQAPADLPAPSRGTGPGQAAPEPAWPGFRPFEVTDLVRETATVTSLYLRPDDRHPLPGFRPGQYLTVRLPPASGDRSGVVRNYSLSSSPSPDRYRISVKHEAHGVVSTFLNRDLRVGDRLDFAAPRGEFVLDSSHRPILLVSAGIGVTPVLAMLHALVDAQTPREVHWLHAARSPDEHAFREEASRLVERLPSGHAHVFYSAPAASHQPHHGGASRHEVRSGRMSRQALVDLHLPSDAEVYVCGPDPFIRDMNTLFADLGVPPERFHVELFRALDAVNPGVVAAPAVQPHPPGSVPVTPGEPTFPVTFARSGLSVEWAPPHGSLLELAEACDVRTRWACRTGVCHTCITPVVSGEVEYVVPPLETPPPDEALVCCSRPATALVLDL
jgi:ferredoxin-NADP reductase/MOSC domain-containing protein YiiM